MGFARAAHPHTRARSGGCFTVSLVDVGPARQPPACLPDMPQVTLACLTHTLHASHLHPAEQVAEQAHGGVG